MHQLSKHNIISRIADSGEYFIVNLLSGNADIIDEKTHQSILENSFENQSELLEKGYLVKPDEEQKLFRSRYLDFLDSREGDEVQIFFVPWYSCNFSCSYCYQDEYSNEKSVLTHEIIDTFFTQIKQQFGIRKKYITLFGGEPLLTGNHHKGLITYFLEKLAENNLQVAIVTNGFSLNEYLPFFTKSIIREIQVTLDGTADIHNKRRFLKDKSPTFSKISEGVDLLLKNEIPVNLRMVVDKENLENLPEFAKYTIEKGWTKSPHFKTQLGRNYELHHCQNQRQKLYSRIELYQDLYRLIKTHPHILEFHKPAFSVSKFLFENGELPEPLFDSCPACKTEWAFDYTGKIYPCTATVGKKDEELGTYYPSYSLNKNTVCDWEDRDVTAIEDCKNCNMQLACGGGCGSVAKNNNSGNLLKPDCRPVKQLLEMGLSLYQQY
jgi:uncharacterized protein